MQILSLTLPEEIKRWTWDHRLNGINGNGETLKKTSKAVLAPAKQNNVNAEINYYHENSDVLDLWTNENVGEENTSYTLPSNKKKGLFYSMTVREELISMIRICFLIIGRSLVML